MKGLGVSCNYDSALYYFKQGEKEKDSSSLNGLGYMYLHGLGVEKNKQTALKYFYQSM
jgi:TPR repeat protein